MANSYPPRSSLQVTLDVYRALFLREAVTRLFKKRTTWVLLFLEPVFHIAVLTLIYTLARIRVIGGIETGVWLMLGLLSYFLFRRTALQAKEALNSNQALFAYRQIKPVDTILVRGCLEGFLLVLVAIIVLFGAGLAGTTVVPADPLLVFQALGGLWLLGLGFGLVASVGISLVPEVDKVIDMVWLPLYLISGVVMPIASINHQFREWLILNPIVHGIEAARLGFAPYYHAAPELSIPYLYVVSIVLIFLGLVLHRRFEDRLIAK